ncbi:DUF998 domain-containing protein [Phytohabitans sp. LJ34]|uniref:DUF998 domain-containing protein n=1 Tax=Phytohabitans sp. LJ34 TaxID=3452217 RepID=UPI003F8C65CC
MAQIAATPTAVARPSRTTALLTAGVLAGPIFVVSVLAQAFTRDGFDPRRHPLSLLALGDLGWIQTTNFVACGVLAFASAFGLRRVLRGGRAGTWGPILIGTYGVGLVWGGVFSADPAYGFPVGTPDGAPEQLSWHGILHGIAPAVAAVALVAAAFVFARRFAAEGRRGWVAYSVAAVVADLGLTSVTFATDDYRWMLAGGIVIWTWAAAVTAQVARTRA